MIRWSSHEDDLRKAISEIQHESLEANLHYVQDDNPGYMLQYPCKVTPSANMHSDKEKKRSCINKNTKISRVFGQLFWTNICFVAIIHYETLENKVCWVKGSSLI